MLLYVKVRSRPPGFWGLTANRVAELERSASRWYAVFLLGGSDTGYLVPAHGVLRRTEACDWRLSSDGDYKVNEGINLDLAFRFSSFDELLNRLLAGMP